MNSLIERQALIDQEVVDALIIATPETWHAADMQVLRGREGEQDKLMITISSPEGHLDSVGPTDEILEALRKLLVHFREHEKTWVEVIYKALMKENGDWTYSIQFKY
ncbi:hypothetical protein ACQ86G_18940 [Roseateles chitinivorans]|uniref:hypothetical protein n=1 Tax=Roseateles chitinivorans TaxID=2917965 RepID=UPI003D67E969